MKTIEELEKFLEDECYSFQCLSIGKHHAPEGIVIEKVNDKYYFNFRNGGKKELLRSFRTKKFQG